MLLGKDGLNVDGIDNEASGISFNDHQFVNVFTFILSPEMIEINQMFLQLS